MVLEYVSLGILCLGATMVVYVFLFIHDIPYRVAKKRGHPQAEAIHVACWLSLFTLQALWPIVFMWAVSNRLPLTVSVARGGGTPSPDLPDISAEATVAELRESIAALGRRVAAIEGGQDGAEVKP